MQETETRTTGNTRVVPGFICGFAGFSDWLLFSHTLPNARAHPLIPLAVPRARPRDDRLDRRLSRGRRGPVGLAIGAAGRHRGHAARRSARARRGLGRDPRRHRSRRHARHHALAKPQLLRLLSGQRLVSRDSRRSAERGPGRQRHDVGDQPGCDGDRDAGDGLARADGRAARVVSF